MLLVAYAFFILMVVCLLQGFSMENNKPLAPSLKI